MLLQRNPSVGGEVLDISLCGRVPAEKVVPVKNARQQWYANRLVLDTMVRDRLVLDTMVREPFGS